MEANVRSEVIKIVQSMLTRQQQKTGNLEGAAGNSAYITDQTIAAPGAAPSSFIYESILLTAQTSGVFAYGWGVPFNSGTTGDAITLATKTVGWTTANWSPIKATGKIVLTGATAEGVQGAYAGGAINVGSAPGVYTATTGGTPITATVTGASPTTSTQSSVIIPTLTALLTTQGMQWNSGELIAQNAVSTTKVPFALGSPVLIEFVVSASNTITMTGSGFFWAYELPIA